MTRQGRKRTEGPSPSSWDGMIERKIAEAHANGHFENLKDAGKPLDLRQNPFQDPAWRLALHVLENAGMAPAWVEERRSFQEAIAELRQPQPDQRLEPGSSVEEQSDTDEAIRALNKRIECFNLTVPHPAFRLKPIRR